MIEILAICLFGILIGLFAGIVPGMHINTLLPFILFLAFYFKISSHYLAVLIVSIAVTEIFINFISSIFIGAPEADTALSVLPGHRLLLEGRGYEAIKLTVVGGIGGLILTLVIISVFSSWFKVFYENSRSFIHWIIIAFVIFMILSERKVRKILSSSLIFFLSGFLGFISLNSYLVNQQNILFPILTGLFGLPTLLISISETNRIPKQEDDAKLKISRKEIIKAVSLGSVAGILVGFLPAVGISEAATLVQYIGGARDARSFLITISGINIGNEVFSLISLYLVSNPRSGPSVAIQRILGEISFFEVLLFIGAICFSSGIAAALTLFLGRKIPKYLEKISYRILCLSVITFLIFMIFMLTGIFGLLIAFTSASIGLLCNYLKTKRSHCMGCLLFPSILFFSGLNYTMISFLGL
ncbi:MAG: tripartite tricarboxylate transporter permease [Candidatus Aenigmatarchaeota archaeon]